MKYLVLDQGRIVAKGVTDAKGNIEKFVAKIGTELSLHVERFGTDEMKKVKTLVPWADQFSVKLLSGKVKQEVPLQEAKGNAGEYQRRTYKVKPKDNLWRIARDNGTSVQELARLNGIKPTDMIHPDQVLKLPLRKDGAAPDAPDGPPPPPPPPPPAPPPPAPVPHDDGPVEPQPAPPPPSPPIPEQKPEATPPAGAGQPVPAKPEPGRGENGTPKTTIPLVCDQSGCIKLGDKGPLIEEINIRLTGFGGTATADKPFAEFTAKTEAAVKRFQEDYMGVAGTGKVCGAVLIALDEFRTKYPVSMAGMACPCGKCKGFGNGYTTSEKAGIKNGKGWHAGTEFPGMHRALLWAMRAALFYTSVKEKALGYKFLAVSSGYRCWYNNKQHSRTSTNHMGNALDLQFTRNGGKVRCAGADVDTLRAKVFVARMGAQLSWPNKNKVSLETAKQGAKSWVHMDVREFHPALKADRYYATSQGAVDGLPLMELAKQENRLKLVNCAGIPPAAPKAEEKTDRLPIDSLKLSAEGIEFIKGWEKYGEKPYDDSEGYCTVGFGHLLAKKTCASMKAAKDAEYELYKDGVTKDEAEKILKKDIKRITDKAKLAIQVPMYQHEFDAVMSLAFNCGGISKFPKLMSKLNTKDYNGCCDEFADITNGGQGGLVKRRQAEMKMFRNKIYDSTH
ncbi:glycoside hydrolase family protein [Pseudoduganella flava]|uniref:glycoside hydrolase family protein n=1 Tax=Pseudoduganella flava TaxID=871742 RepID=UPI0013037540|nr:LysM peptidoglycan-binding domain-containing protein [Pseudoduganella flava]